MIFPYAPLPPPFEFGGMKRNGPFLQENLKRHEVSILSYGTREEEKKCKESFGKACKYIHFVDKRRPRMVNGLEQLWLLATGRSTFRQLYRKKMQRVLDELTAKEKFDLIHCCTHIFGYFRFPKDVSVVGDAHEVTYELIYRTYKKTRNAFLKVLSYMSFKFGKREEIMISKIFDALIATQQRDCEILSRDLPEQRIFVVSNGVDPSFLECQNQEPEPDPRTMVFTGKMNFYPNDHGILYFIDEILPLVLSEAPDARLFVVGQSPSKGLRNRASRQVIVTGYVEDVRPYVARAEVFVIPLLIGGGIRIKALEAMAMRKPIVSTSIGCEGINLKHEDSALFADTARDFSAAVLRLFKDKALRARLAEKAYANVTDGYNWKAKGEELDRMYQEVVLSHTRSGRSS